MDEARTESRYPLLVVLSPWDKRIGPNRYLASFLASDRALAAQTIVLLAEEGQAAEEYRAMGCAVEVWPAARLVHVRFTVTNLIGLLRAHTLDVARLSRRLRQLHARLVLTNSENVWLGGMAARLAGIPHAQVFHALTLDYHWGSHPSRVRIYLKFLSLLNARFIAVSSAVAGMLERYGVPQASISVIPNALDVSAIERASREALPDEIARSVCSHSPVLVTLGRMSAVKGHDLLLEGLSAVARRYPDFICICAGQVLSDKGVEDTAGFSKHLQEQIRQRHLDGHILFPGEVDYAPALVKRADVYIQPSRTESFCRAVAEAMICGTPVVAFRTGGIPEVLGDGGGVLVRPGDGQALGEAVMNLLDNPARRNDLAECARQNVLRYDVRRVWPLFAGFVNSVADSHGAREG